MESNKKVLGINNGVIISIMILLLVASSCRKDGYIQNDLLRENINGSVHIITYYSSDAYERFGKIERGNLHMTERIIYNKDGNILEDDDFKFVNPVYKYIFRYSSSGKREEAILYNNDNLDEKTTYEYDSRGNLTVENIYKADGILFQKKIRKIDNNGNILEKNVYNSDGSLFEKYTYQYSLFNNEITEYEYRTDGSYSNTSKHKDYGNGYEVEVSGDYELAAWNNVYCSDFQYDSHHNWIKKKRNIEPGKPEFFLERTIDYY